MLQSQFCILDNLMEKDMYELNECPYDKGGYFVINGSEKVLIAQERMATNRVYVFAKSQPSPVSYLAEIRSAVEKGGKTISSMQIKMMRRTERQVRPLSVEASKCFEVDPLFRLLAVGSNDQVDDPIHPRRHPDRGRLPSSRHHSRSRHPRPHLLRQERF